MDNRPDLAFGLNVRNLCNADLEMCASCSFYRLSLALMNLHEMNRLCNQNMYFLPPEPITSTDHRILLACFFGNFACFASGVI